MKRRRPIVFIAAGVLVVIGVIIVVPHPEVFQHLIEDRAYPRAVLAAYRIAVKTHRPSNVPLTGVTYTFLVGSRDPDEIEIVFLPRTTLQRLVTEPPEEIHVIVRRPSMSLVRWHFAE